MVVMDVFTRRIIRFGVAANLDGPGVCRLFNHAIARQSMPKYLSSDHDPLFRFQRWLANLRILEIDEIKSIPGTPRSHAFIERLIGTIRREYLDQTLFWNQGDLERKLDRYKVYYKPTSLPRRTGRHHPGSAQRRACPSNCKPSLIPLAQTLRRPLSDPGRRLNGISPHTGIFPARCASAPLGSGSGFDHGFAPSAAARCLRSSAATPPG
jgi:Integrase core domain